MRSRSPWQVPCIGIIHLVPFILHQPSEPPFQLLVIRLLLELQVPGINQQLLEFVGDILTQELQRGGQLFLHYLLVLLFLVVCFQVLPRQVPFREVQQHIGDPLNVIPSALLDPQMGVQRGVPSCACEVLIVLVGNVGIILLNVFLGQPEVYQVELVGLLVSSHQEVVRLDVPVDELLPLYKLDSLEHLNGELGGGFQIKSFSTLIEEILQGWPQQIHNQNVEFPLCAAEVGVGYTLVKSLIVVKKIDQLSLIEELWMLGVHLLTLHSHLVGVLDVDGEVDLSEGSSPQLLLHLVGLSDSYVNHLLQTQPHVLDPLLLIKSSSVRLEFNLSQFIHAYWFLVINILYEHQSLQSHRRAQELLASQEEYSPHADTLTLLSGLQAVSAFECLQEAQESGRQQGQEEQGRGSGERE